MSDAVKIALIAAVTTVICVGAVIYYLPGNSCVRAYTNAIQAKGAKTDPEEIRMRGHAFCNQNRN